MARYIDADELKNRMFNYYECVNENTAKENYRGETLMAYEVADMIEDCIDNAPTADVVEVVRCKECRYRNTQGCPMHHNGYNINGDDDYCSYGVKKE